MAKHDPVMADITDPEVREKIYVEVHMSLIKENVLDLADEMGVELSEDDAGNIAWSYVCNGGYDNDGFWDTLKSLIEKCVEDRTAVAAV